MEENESLKVTVGTKAEERRGGLPTSQILMTNFLVSPYLKIYMKRRS